MKRTSVNVGLIVVAGYEKDVERSKFTTCGRLEAILISIRNKAFISFPQDRKLSPGVPMLAILLSFRFVLLVAAAGAMGGALMMFWEGALKLKVAFLALVYGGGGDKVVIAAIMSAVDKYLFGLVLVILAYAITFGFVLDLDEAARERLPDWMKVSGVGELKHTFLEVILVYLAVDFATDVASAETHVSWETLVMPLSILALAAAVRLLTHKGPREPARKGGAEL